MASNADLQILIRFAEENLGVLRDVKGQLAEVERSAKSLSLQAAGANLNQYVTAPLVDAGKAAIGLATGFDASMNKIVALVGIGREQVTAWKDDVTSISLETGVAERELADALFFITSAGLRGAEAMDALRASAMAADAGLGETKVIADAVTSAMNAYGSETLSAGQATAVLVAAVREGKMPAEALAGSIGRILPLAAEMGISFDQVGAAIASMTRLGLDANEATTALRGTMAGMIKPSEDASKTLRTFGLTFADLRKVVREQGLLEGLLLLRDRIGDNDVAMTKIFPNVRALTGVLNLVGQNADEARQIFANLAQVTEQDLVDAFEAAQEAASDKFEDALNALNIALRKIGDVILPIVVPAVERLTQIVIDAAKGWDSLSQPMKLAILSFAAIVAAVGPAVLGLGVLTAVLGALLSPLGLVTIAVAVLAAAFIADFGGIRTAVVPIIEELAEVADRALAGDFVGALMVLGEALTDALANLEETIGAMVQAVVDNAPAFVEQLGFWAAAFVAWVIEAAPVLLRHLLELLGSVLKFVADNAPQIVEALISEWVPAFIGWVLGTALPRLIGVLFELLGSITHWIVTDAAPTIGEFSVRMGEAIITGILAGIENLKTQLWNKAVEVVLGAKDAVVAAIQAGSPSLLFAAEVGVPIMEGIGAGILAAAGGVQQALVSTIQSWADEITQAVEALEQAAEDAFNPTFDLGGVIGALPAPPGGAQPGDPPPPGAAPVIGVVGSPPIDGNCPTGMVMWSMQYGGNGQCYTAWQQGPCPSGMFLDGISGGCISTSRTPSTSPGTTPPGTTQPPATTTPPQCPAGQVWDSYYQQCRTNPIQPPANAPAVGGSCRTNECYANGVWYKCWEVPVGLRSLCKNCCPGYGFAHGGIVPGPIGAPLLATVHGGEMILPSGVAQQVIRGSGTGGGSLAVTVDMRGAQVYGIDDLEQRVLTAVTQAYRRGGLSFLASR